MHYTFDVAIRIETRAMRAIALARRRDQPKALIMAQCLLMHLGFERCHTYYVPCAVAFLGHLRSSLSCRVYFGSPAACQLLKQLALLVGQAHGQHDFDTSKEVTIAVTAQARHALVCQAEHAPVLRLRRDGQNESAPVRGGYREFPSPQCWNPGRIYIARQTIPLVRLKRIGFE